MKVALLRTGSVPSLQAIFSGPERIGLHRNESFNRGFSGERNSLSSPTISMHLVRSVAEESGGVLKRRYIGSRSLPCMITEEKCITSSVNEVSSIWSSRSYPVEETGFSGDGFGKGNKSGGGRNRNDGFNGGSGDLSKLGDYYREMLKSNPLDPLLLRNYAKYLHEVEGDTKRAEEYYGRAILANPGDGEVLSLYGKLIWEEHRDCERAKSYFDQALYVSPNDSMVLGSYASFIWEADDDEENEKTEESPPPMVCVF